ncbi:hypothetical protein ACFORG_19150 [Lutimaribacter marinistellae]|uniref:Uncharacterized protein n=1 Tax=Lutimaribacter marinistellae TaxID=1820329 RepID=A0ABV7TM84_9RHOB
MRAAILALLILAAYPFAYAERSNAGEGGLRITTEPEEAITR